MCACLWVVCVFIGSPLNSDSQQSCCFLQRGESDLCQLKIWVSTSLCMQRHHWLAFAEVFFFSLKCYFQQRQWKQPGCWFFSNRFVLCVGRYLAVLGSRIQPHVTPQQTGWWQHRGSSAQPGSQLGPVLGQVTVCPQDTCPGVLWIPPLMDPTSSFHIPNRPVCFFVRQQLLRLGCLYWSCWQFWSRLV